MIKLTAIAISIMTMLGGHYAVAAEPIEVITPAKITEPEKVELGKMLFSNPDCRNQALSPVILAIIFLLAALMPCPHRLATIGRRVQLTHQPC